MFEKLFKKNKEAEEVLEEKAEEIKADEIVEEAEAAADEAEAETPGDDVSEADDDFAEEVIEDKSEEEPAEEESEPEETVEEEASEGEAMPDEEPEAVEQDAEEIEVPDEEDFEEDASFDEDHFDEGEELKGVEDESEYTMEETPWIEEEKKKPIGRKILKVLLGIVGFLLIAYLAVSLFFIKHFYYDTTINGVDFSLKSAEDVEKYMSKQVDDYKLTIQELQDATEQIVGADIDIQYKQSTQIKRQLKAQNPLLWVTAFWQPDNLEADVGVDYNETKLADLISKLECMNQEKWTTSTSAHPEYDGTQFVVAKEVYGTSLNVDVFNKAVRDAIGQFQSTVNLEEAGCYQPPKFLSTSPEVQTACDNMNNYSKASITYTFGDATEVVDRNVIKDWLTVNMDTMEVTYHKGKVKEYMKALGEKYDTIGKQRTITSPVGETVKVSGGIYGWELDEEKETKALKEHIKNGETITKEPAWVQKAASFGDVDWGSTYAEVDISRQHAWYIKDGKVTFEFDVVTGLPTAKRATPTGVWMCLEKARNKTLRGDRKPNGKYEYETPVAYWMRVTWSGVGFHTATWQPSFGGNRYTYAGSHGCINMSYKDSVTLYGIIQVGDPVIIHK